MEKNKKNELQKLKQKILKLSEEERKNSHEVEILTSEVENNVYKINVLKRATINSLIITTICFIALAKVNFDDILLLDRMIKLFTFGGALSGMMTFLFANSLFTATVVKKNISQKIKGLNVELEMNTRQKQECKEKLNELNEDKKEQEKQNQKFYSIQDEKKSDLDKNNVHTLKKKK